MLKNIVTPLFILLMLESCYSNNKTPASNYSPEASGLAQQTEKSNQEKATSIPTDTTTYSSDSLQYLALTSFELVAYQLVPDTLKLVSTSNFLYHPFGSFASVSAFRKAASKFTFQQEPDTLDSTVQIHRGILKNSFIKLFQDDEKKTLEIVSGRIFDKEVELANGIRVGMSKRLFFSSFFKKPSTTEKIDLKVIELISGLDGIRHYYVFKNSVLTSIEFDSDYQFNKQ